jgi:alpha-ribazole phosphatase
MRAIVVRHYKTAGNLANEIIGWTESPPAHGWQADMLKVLESLRASKLYLNQIYTSDLKRAHQTGEVYANNLNCGEVIQVPELREINYGRISKKRKSWVEKHIPEHKRDPDFIYPQGESFAQMQHRSVDFISSLTEQHENDTLLIVAHAGVIRGLICHFLGLDYASNLRRKITHRYIGDFSFEGNRCVGYDELGTVSGFIKDGLVKIPLKIEHSQ